MGPLFLVFKKMSFFVFIALKIQFIKYGTNDLFCVRKRTDLFSKEQLSALKAKILVLPEPAGPLIFLNPEEVLS